MASCSLCRKGLREQFVAKSNGGECLVSGSPTVFFSQHAVMLKWEAFFFFIELDVC